MYIYHLNISYIWILVKVGYLLQEAEEAEAPLQPAHQQQMSETDEALALLLASFDNLNAAMESYRYHSAALSEAERKEFRLLTEMGKAAEDESTNLDAIKEEWSTAHSEMEAARAKEQAASAAAVEAIRIYRLKRKATEDAYANAKLPLPADFPPPAPEDDSPSLADVPQTQVISK